MLVVLMRVGDFCVGRILPPSKPNKRQGTKGQISNVRRKKAYPAEPERARYNTACSLKEFEAPMKQDVGAEYGGRSCLSSRILFWPWDSLATHKRF